MTSRNSARGWFGLADHHRICRRAQLLLTVDSQPTGFIFTGATGAVLQPRKADMYFASVRTRAGLDAHKFHGLRHDFASLLLAAGVADRVVMEMMGHSSYTITANRYQHVPDELQYLAADRLDNLLSVAKP